jgi:chromate reductase, NAD(P)H dehydrogenase (quinone)
VGNDVGHENATKARLANSIGDREWSEQGSANSPMRILMLCGSLRARSSNRSVLRAYERLIGAQATVEHYERLGLLPHFNPDLDSETEALPKEVAGLRSLITGASAVVVSTPEYVHALPGSFKNALDWLVSDPAFAGKRVAILHIARGSTWALDSLREVLKTMSAVIVENASVSLSLGSNQVDEEAILAREDLRTQLSGSVEALFDAINPKPNT